MIEINITNQEIEKTFKEIHNEVLKINEIKEKQIEEYQEKNNLKISDQDKRNFFSNYLNLFNASILQTIITLVTNKINQLRINKNKIKWRFIYLFELLYQHNY